MEDKDAIIAELREQIKMLLKRIQHLEDEVSRLKKDSGNSSKTPSSDIVKPLKVIRRMGAKRKRGGQPGHVKQARKPFAPDQVDYAFEYEFEDAEGLIPLNDWYVVQQITLPEKLYVVTEHRARKYHDPKTGVLVIAPLPEEIKQGQLLGADISVSACILEQ